MDRNQKKFNLYVFISTFARNLIEVFIPMILYKYGYSLKEVIFYYFFVNLFSLLLSYPFLVIAKKINYKNLSMIGIISFVIVQLMLNKIVQSKIYLVLLALMYAMYRRGYWIPRRYFNLKVIHKEDISIAYAIISVINQLALIASSYIGAILLDFVNIGVLTGISIMLFFISIIPLYKMEFESETQHSKIKLFDTAKKMSFVNIYYFGAYELLNVLKFLFPLYLAIYVKDTYQVVGILNVCTNIATLLFVYLYGKKINGKKNYLQMSIAFCVIIYLLKANNTSYVLAIIAFLEGLCSKMYELSINKEFYTLSKKFEYENYNFAYEFTQNLTRTIVVLILLLFVKEIKIMIYVVLVFISIGMILDFKKIDGKDYVPIKVKK